LLPPDLPHVRVADQLAALLVPEVKRQAIREHCTRSAQTCKEFQARIRTRVEERVIVWSADLPWPRLIPMSGYLLKSVDRNAEGPETVLRVIWTSTVLHLNAIQYLRAVATNVAEDAEVPVWAVGPVIAFGSRVSRSASPSLTRVPPIYLSNWTSSAHYAVRTAQRDSPCAFLE